MRPPARLTLCLGLLLAAVALLPSTDSGAASPRTPGAASLGLPSQSSLLFTLDAKAGRMSPVSSAGKDRYRLDLTGVDERTVWFADRPRRDAGRLATDRFLAGWGNLGFRADPPNAALVARVGRHTRTVAVELKLRRYSRRERSASFDARVLGSLGGGLDHLNRSLGTAPSGEFVAPTLFVDNGGSEPRCTLGETRLMSISPGSKASISGMLPADGRTLQIGADVPLFTLIGNAYGGNGSGTFDLPKLSAPAGTTWYICAEGFFPQGETLTPDCVIGETVLWALPGGLSSVTQWAPADGRRIPVGEAGEYAQRYGGGEATVALPTVAAPAGMSALTCLYSPQQGVEPSPVIGQLDLFPALQPEQEGRWSAAAGQAVPSSTPLGSLLAADPELKGKAPSLPAAGTSANWFISSAGSWPLG